MRRGLRMSGVFLFALGTLNQPAISETPVSPDQFLGYPMGEWLTDHDQMLEYLRLLDESGSRTRLYQYGSSYEHRDLVLFIVSASENMERLSSIEENLNLLCDPMKTSEDEARSVARDLPAVVWLNFGNDGNESAAFEAALYVAHRLTAAHDPETKAILKDVVTVINPCHNPESHQRFVAWFKASHTRPGGRLGDPNPDAYEHEGDWRMDTNNNHYQIDLNRDAFAATQVETRELIEELHRWHPQVFVDSHGETDNYFFAPYARPINANYPESISKWANVIGAANANAFARRGWSFFTSEVFDLFYSGYWDTYPALNGAVGMTYETTGGGSRGFAMERKDDTIVDFATGIEQHVTACFATLKAAAENRQALLHDYYDFRASGVKLARRAGYSGYLMAPGRDPGRAEALARLMRLHRVEVLQAEAGFDSKARRLGEDNYENVSFPAGTYFIPAVQPQFRLLNALFEIDPELDPEFMAGVLDAHEYNKTLGSRARKQRLGFYDLTAWSLPFAYGVPTFEAKRRPGAELAPLPAEKALATEELDRASYGYVISGDRWSSAPLLVRLLNSDYKASVTSKEFEVDGRTFGRGSILLRVSRNPESLHQDVERLAREFDVPVHPVSSAFTERGVDLGSAAFVNVRVPYVCLVADEPVSPTSFGALWYFLEMELGVRFSVVRAARLGKVNLDRFSVLIVPNASPPALRRTLGESVVDKLESWVLDGGTFIGIAGSSAFAIDEEVGLASSRLMGSRSDEEDEPASAKPVYTPGAIARVELDERHWLTYGMEPELAALVNSRRVFLPSSEGTNVGIFGDEVRLGGFMFEEAEDYLPGKSYLIHESRGKGHVILFAEEPYFRLFWKGSARLLINAILFPPESDSGSPYRR